jgi:hydrogenase maturation protease
MAPERSCGTDRVLVLGLGNILLKDEGVGVHIAQKLQELALPEYVEVIDAGTGSFDVLLSALGVEKVVVIDALRAGNEAGTIYKASLHPEERDKLKQVFGGDSSISLHQTGLIDSLVAAEKMNCAPKEIIIFGVEPKKIEYGLELTDKVRRRVPEIINEVLREIRNAIHAE